MVVGVNSDFPVEMAFGNGNGIAVLSNYCHRLSHALEQVLNECPRGVTGGNNNNRSIIDH